MTLRLFHTLLQLAGTASATAGVFLLFGWAWALTVGGLSVLLGSVVTEATLPRVGER